MCCCVVLILSIWVRIEADKCCLCRCIQAEHFGKLALPVAEFLALTNDTAYAGYAALGSESLEQIQEEPFFNPAPRPTVVGASQASPKKAHLARHSPSSPGKHPRSPNTGGAAQLDRINTGIHDTVMHPITCTPSSTLKEVRPHRQLVPGLLSQIRLCEVLQDVLLQCNASEHFPKNTLICRAQKHAWTILQDVLLADLSWQLMHCKHNVCMNGAICVYHLKLVTPRLA